MQKLLKTLVPVITVAALAGCASTGETDTTAQDALSTAERAAADAAAAQRDAAAAKAAADQAMAEARGARQAAEDAAAASRATDAKLDRMFKKAMYK